MELKDILKTGVSAGSPAPGDTALFYDDSADALKGYDPTSVGGSGSSPTVFNIKDYGAACDRSGITGTDDTSAVVDAYNDAKAVRGILYVPGETLIRKTTSGGSVLTFDKGVSLVGGGGGAGLYWSNDTPTSTNGVTFAPTAHPHNENIQIRDITIGPAACVPHPTVQGAWSSATASGQHALVLDATGLADNAPFRYLQIKNARLWGNFANGSSAGNYGIYLPDNGSWTGSIAQSVIGPANHVFNGMFLENIGDTMTICDNTFMVYNDVYIATTNPGVTTLSFLHNNITNRKGLTMILPVSSMIQGNIIEGVESDTVGVTGKTCMVYVTGISSAYAAGSSFIGNQINCQSPAANLDLLRVEDANDFLVNQNSFLSQSGSHFINHAPSGTQRLLVALNSPLGGLGGYITSSTPSQISYYTRGRATEATATVDYPYALAMGGVTYSALTTAIPTPYFGQLAVITDSNTNTWGATIAGSGSNKVLAFWNNTNWTVAGK